MKSLTFSHVGQREVGNGCEADQRGMQREGLRGVDRVSVFYLGFLFGHVLLTEMTTS